MSLRAPIAFGVALVVGLLLMRDMGSAPPAPIRSPRARAARPPRSSVTQPLASTRNVFEFASRPAPEQAPRPAATLAPLSPEVFIAPIIVAPVRFVGLVRRGGTLKAALQVHGESAVLGMGEAAGGYTVVAIDDDGVRLRAADGTTLALSVGGP